MGLFSKARHDKDSDYIIPYEDNSTEFKMTPAGEKSNIHAPHALTAKEVLGETDNAPQRQTENIAMNGAAHSSAPLDALRNKMMAARQKEISRNENKPDVQSTQTHSVPSVAVPTAATPQKKSSSESTSLLEKCMPYITEGDQEPPKEKPDYTLDSVDSIINTTGKKAAELLEKLNRYGNVQLSYDDLSKPTYQTSVPEKKTENEEPQKVVKSEKADTVTGVVKPQVSCPTETIQMETVFPEKLPVNGAKSGGDIASFTKTFSAITKNDIEDISSGARIFDLSSEFFEENQTTAPEIPEPIAEEDTEDFEVEEDYCRFEDAKHIGRNLSLKRRGAFLKAFFSFLITAVLGVLRIPAIYTQVNASLFSAITLCLFIILAAIHYDMFAAIATLFSPRKKAESAIGIATAATLIYAISAIITKDNAYNAIMLCSISVCFKAVACFMKNAYILGNFKVIATPADKYAVTFIDDRATSFAMARGAIDGDVLIGTSVKTTNVLDFIKNTSRDNAMNSKLGVLILFSLICSVICGFAGGVYAQNLTEGLSFFCTALLLMLSPTVLFTDILPIRRANKALNKKGAMLTGSTAAFEIEQANAVTLHSSDLFPAGTISLHNMKILDPNRIDVTLIDAAALTKEIGSPLYGVFATIAKTQDKNLPVADSVKYEERLGISGWVDDRHIFIGNRTLLEAHGISTPPVEIDKKILRQGFFPVYVATDSKPCALILIKYNVLSGIALQLQKLCDSGITLLINTCDPNLTDEMICDYFDLYEDSVKVMNSSGSQFHKNATEYQKDISAFAAHKGSAAGFAAIFTKAGKIKKSIITLSSLQIISSVLLFIAFIYGSYIAGTSALYTGAVFLYTAANIVITYLVYLFNRP